DPAPLDLIRTLIGPVTWCLMHRSVGVSYAAETPETIHCASVAVPTHFPSNADRSSIVRPAHRSRGARLESAGEREGSAGRDARRAVPPITWLAGSADESDAAAPVPTPRRVHPGRRSGP